MNKAHKANNGHILGFQNVYNRAEGIADCYWPWAVFFIYCLRNKNVLKLEAGSLEKTRTF